MEDTSKNRSDGYLMIGSNGNSIFLPVVEWRDEDSIVRTGGFYWSSAPDRTDVAIASICHIKSMGIWRRCDGLRIRPVGD